MEIIKLILAIIALIIVGIILTFLICASIIVSEIRRIERENNKEMNK